MNTPAKLSAVAVTLAAVFVASVGVGRAVGPVGAATPVAPAASPHGNAHTTGPAATPGVQP